jgi:hypothetical protein
MAHAAIRVPAPNSRVFGSHDEILPMARIHLDIPHGRLARDLELFQLQKANA